MTLPDERYRSLVYARDLLMDLTDPRKTPRIPQIIRDRARGALRHYPSDWDMLRAAEQAPDVFQQHMEPVTRLFKQYEQSKTSK